MSRAEMIKSENLLIVNPDIKISKVNWHEFGKYLAVVMKPKEIA